MDNRKQPELLSQPDNKQLDSGPVFEAGPGWGERLAKRFKKFSAEDLLPIILMILVAIVVFLALNR